MWAPHVRCPVSLTRWHLTWETVIWTPREPISKFRDPDVHFGSSGTWMTPAAKFKGRPCILLNEQNINTYPEKGSCKVSDWILLI